MRKEPIFYAQILPLVIAFVSGAFFLAALFANIKLAEFIFPREPIQIVFGLTDLALGFYLYLKTSIDFAVFIGAMMSANPGWKNRVALEWGTSLGNFAGTIAVIWVWIVFREVSPAFEGLIVVIASFVLLELAAGSLTRLNPDKLYTRFMGKILEIRRFTAPFLGWMPDVEGAMAGKKAAGFMSLLGYSFTIPFILGSDDFAGYMSVFNVVNIFPFAAGVILGHMLLLAGLFSAPAKVERLLGRQEFSALAVATFIVIFIYGFLEGGRLLLDWGKTNIYAFSAILVFATFWATSHRLRRIARTGFELTRERALRLIRHS